MKHFESILSRIDYFKWSRQNQGEDNFRDSLGNNVIIYDAFLENGFKDFYSYHSIVTHEMYLRMDEKIFVFCNGANYFIEAQNETLINAISQIFPDNSILWNDALTIQCKFMNSNIIKKLAKI